MPRYKPLSNRILFLSDDPSSHTGLARSARDIATLAASLPEFQVGFLGRGTQGHRKLPFTMYSYPAVSGGWGEYYLANAASNFFESERGIVFTNWDACRVGFFSGRNVPLELARAYDRNMRNWDAWLYAPVDSCGPDGQRMGIECRENLTAFDRVLAPSEWGMKVLQNSGRPDADFLPHGIWMDKFTIDLHAREKLGIDLNQIRVGCLMANQFRKDFPVAFETASVLRQKYGNRFRLWVHTDTLINYWNIYSLAADYGITDCLEVTVNATDEELALRYSACDCTILPSAAEGFGYSIAESLACGTACIVTDYAAGPELVAEDCRVKPVTFRVDNIFNTQRAVLSGWGFARLAEEQIERKRADPEYRGEELRESVIHLDWARLRYPWETWLKAGLR